MEVQLNGGGYPSVPSAGVRGSDASRGAASRTDAAAAAALAAAKIEVGSVAWQERLEFYVNGKRVVVDDAQPQQTLLTFLRERLGLTGTKLGCGEGGCGACTVTVAHYDRASKAAVYRAVNACLAPLCSVDGCSVTTVEGIGTTKKPHPVQERLAACHGSQCGFCTPGIVMSLFSALQKSEAPTVADIEATFDGNLCRCTGYRPILDAAKTFARDPGNCPSAPAGFDAVSASPAAEHNVKICSSSCATIAKYDGAQTADVIHMQFPEALRMLAAATPAPLRISGSRITWYRPANLECLLALKTATPTAKLVAGNTEVGIETKFKHSEYPVMISTWAVQELHELCFDSDGSLWIGGAVTLSRIEHFLEHALTQRPADQSRGLRAILDMLRWFASGQIRNVAVLAGNIATASPISDLNPVLMALGASLTLAEAGKSLREVDVRDYFKSYRVVDMRPQEIIFGVRVPPASSAYEFVRSFKQAKRRDDDISIVNACIRVCLRPDKDAWVVEEASSGFGGMAPMTVRGRFAEAALQGKCWNEATLEAAMEALAEDLPLPEGVPGGMAAYRQTLASSFLYKFFVGVSLELSEIVATGGGALPPVAAIAAEDAAAARSFLSEDRPVTHGAQRYVVPSGGLQMSAVSGKRDHAADVAEQRAPVGQPLAHKAALQQCTGEAIYVDDIVPRRNELFGAFVLSERAHARIVKVDATAAEALVGVEGFFSAKDITPEQNEMGPVYHDEQLFRSDVVTSTGQPLGIVVAISTELAQRAARLVKVEYSDLEPVLTIEDAIRTKSFHPKVLDITDGDVDAAFALPDTVIVEGEIRMGGQEHFYLETMCAVVVPGEDDELTIESSTQACMKTQKFAAIVCGIPYSKVVARTKRMGGGFGGKETRTILVSSAVALAAHRLHRPVRMMLDRDVDMWITGTRHPFIGKYRAGAGPDGKIRALDLRLFCNAGYSMDLSEAILGRAIFHCDNCYKIPNLRAEGRICMTNTSSNTAFRGFGGPQGMLMAEAWLEHLAMALRLQPEKLRELNLYAAEGEKTHFLQLMDRCPLRRMWSELAQSSDFHARCKEVAEYNKANRWRKRGISLLPTKFGISFTAKFMNQGGALVHVYTDGTVLVTHGGTEMGQGLHTKMAQVAARALGVPADDVMVRETSTETVPNSSPTAGSASSDIYGMAILNACEQIKERLKPYLEQKGGNFKAAVFAAFFDRCDLSAHGFYKTPDIGYDWAVQDCSARGMPFNYFTFGAACAEVEVDILTGDMRIARADLYMDVGNSLNPAIDVGQIEGAFMQGVGWTTLEEVVWGCDEFPWLKSGQCLTRGPGNYKIPSFNDVPVDMRVTLFEDSANPRAIHSSRAVGEPPFNLGAVAFTATRQAIASAREDAGMPGPYNVDSPLTPERIRMACGDKISAKFQSKMTRPRPSGFF